MEGKHKETQSKVEEIKHTINTTLDAQEEVPLFDAIQELAKMEKTNDDEIVETMLKLKQNIDVESIMNILKWDQMSKTKQFKMKPIQWDPEVQKFIKEKFEKTTD